MSILFKTSIFFTNSLLLLVELGITCVFGFLWNKISLLALIVYFVGTIILLILSVVIILYNINRKVTTLNYIVTEIEEIENCQNPILALLGYEVYSCKLESLDKVEISKQVIGKKICNGDKVYLSLLDNEYCLDLGGEQ